MIGIIGAMDEEVAILKESMKVQDTMERAGLLLFKTTNTRSHMRENEMLKETSSPARAFFSPEGAC